jgi:hypothetical protein
MVGIVDGLWMDDGGWSEFVRPMLTVLYLLVLGVLEDAVSGTKDEREGDNL